MTDSSDSGTGSAIDYAVIIIALITGAAATVAATSDVSGLTKSFMAGGLFLISGLLAFRTWQITRGGAKQEESETE
jgi:hypothetical protein